MSPPPQVPHGTGLFVRDGERLFAKVAGLDDAAQLHAEALGLTALRKTATVRVPELAGQGRDEERNWLLLEWLDLEPLDAASGAALGAALAALHRVPQARFGWEHDNFIGSSPQPNGWCDDWLAFWRDKRLVTQLRLAAANRLPSRLIDRGERLASDCGAFFRGYEPAKSLLHGDLWGGNAGAVAGGAPVVFDPAVYVGDREADMAMTYLFGGFPRDFHAAYKAAWPFDDGFAGARCDFYNLYHVLNHANLFAGNYVRQSQDAIDKLLSQIA